MPVATSQRVVKWGKPLDMFGVRLIISIFLCALQFPGLFVDLDRTEPNGDAHLFFHHEDMARRTILSYGEMPAWDPYSCGGIPGIANPQNPALSPDMVFRLAFGTDAGRRLAVFLFFLCGLEGMFRLGRHYGLSPLPSLFSAMVFAMCGRFTAATAVGWLHMLTFFLIPGVLFCFERGLRSWSFRILGGALLAWMILGAGTYPFPYALVVIGLTAVVRTVEALSNRTEQRTFRWYSPAATLCSMIGIALLLSAVRTLPLSMVVFGLPRHVPLSPSQYNAQQLIAFLLDGTRSHYSCEYYFLGPIALLLAFLSCHKTAQGARIMALVFFVLALGNFARFAPFSLLSSLPLFNQLRAAERQLIVVIMYLALAGGFGLAGIAARPRVRFLPTSIGFLLALAVAAVAVTQLNDANRIRAGKVYIDPAPLSDTENGFRQARGNFRAPQYFGALNLGNLACNEATPFPKSAALRADLPAEEYPLDPTVARVNRLRWTPNSIALRVRANKPTRILVNQNYNRYWTANIGGIRNHHGLLAVDVPQGKWRLKLVYRDPWQRVGALISSIALLSALAFYVTLALRKWRALRQCWRGWTWSPETR